MTFDVIDPKNRQYPDLEQIAKTEEWTKNLIPFDIDGFCINEDGNLILMDECGNYAYCPPEWRVLDLRKSKKANSEQVIEEKTKNTILRRGWISVIRRVAIIFSSPT